MNAIYPVAKYFPYVALAARYQQDSGDGDSNLYDYIEDTLHKWLYRPHVTRVPTSIDFSYVVETDDEIILACLGTEGEKAWKSNFNPFPIYNNGMHEGFKIAGDELCDATKHIIATSDKPVEIVTHSRGTTRGLVCQENLFDETGKKARLFHFNGPPIFTRRRAREYNRKKLPGYRVINMCDRVDNIGGFLLKHHKAKLVKLPYVKNRLNSIPLIGWLFGGHAYSSDFDGMIAYFSRRGMWDEVSYLNEKRSVCTI